MNSVELIGRITKDPELKVTRDNKSYLAFTLAIRDGKDKSGKDITQFINCIAWDKAADVIAKYCEKGFMLGVKGKIRINSYKRNDGTMGYETKVHVEEFDLIQSRNQTKTYDLSLDTNFGFTDDDLPY